ncbi:hypothetical protein [Erwinia phage FBB1]|nr:hypothetical protein [Erwinia phage FBB1]
MHDMSYDFYLNQSPGFTSYIKSFITDVNDNGGKVVDVRSADDEDYVIIDIEIPDLKSLEKWDGFIL